MATLIYKVKNYTFLNARAIIEQPLTRIIEYFLISFILFIAVSTIFLMFGLYFEAKFSLVASLILLSTIVICASMLFAAIKIAGTKKWKRTDVYALFGILLISFCGTILSTSINRPDIDDSVYVPKAVYYVDNPTASIDRSVNWIVSPDKIPTLGLFRYYELSQAAFSSILEISYLDFYHIFFPGFVGFFICLSMFLLLSIFEHKRSTTLLSLLFFILLLMALGETHRTYGNLSFARAFQGKFMFLTVGVPTWIYFSLRYFLMRDWLSWIVLLALGIGMAGATSTAMVFLPFLSIAIIVSYNFNEGKLNLSFSAIKLATIYFSTLIPLMLMAIDFRFFAINNIGPASSINSRFPSSFYEQMQLLINPAYPLTPIIFISAFTIVISLSGYRKFFISWVAIIFVFLLNPFVSDFVITNITTENIYWRLFYLLPFPLVACIAFSILINGQRVSKVFAGFLFVLLIPLSFWGSTSILRPENGSTFEMPRYKIESRDLFASSEVIERVSSGSMFAPIELASQILLLSSHYPQFYMRSDYLRFMLGSIGHDKEFNERAKVYDYLYNEAPSLDKKLAFLNIVKSIKKPDHFIIRIKSTNLREIINILLQEGYEHRFFIDDRYEIFSIVKV